MKTLLKTLVILLTLVPFPALADPGVTYYVNANNVNLRENPGLDAAVVATTEFGEELVELKRENGWVKVFPAFGNGEEGWIRATFLAGVRPHPDLAHAADPGFETFKYEVETFNDSVKAYTVDGYYSRIEQGGPDIVYIYVTNRWLRLDTKGRSANLYYLMGLWNKTNGKDRKVTLQLVDGNGNRFMKTTN